MLNPKWYLVCDIRAKTAIDFIQIQETWGAATGLLQQSDQDLEHFYQWSLLNPTISFMPLARAIEYGISHDSIDVVLSNTKPAVLSWLRQMRDPILQASDTIIVPDRWNSLDVVDQVYATRYRQALRDITDSGDPFNVIWPAIPNVLNHLRQIDISTIDRPSEDFLKMLTDPFTLPSLEERRNNQCLRIKALRDQRKAGGVKVVVNGKDYWFWTDDPSRNQYALLTDFARRKGLTDDYVLQDWKTMSGEYVPLTVDLLHQVVDAGIISESLAFNVAKTHQAAIMQLDEPEVYNFYEGWPPSYDDYKKSLTSTN